MHPKLFLTSFKFYYRRNFYLYWPTILFESSHMNCKRLQRDSTRNKAPVSSKEHLDIQATIACRFTLKCVHDMTRTYSHMNYAFSARVTESLEINVFSYNDLVSAVKSSIKYTSNQFRHIFNLSLFYYRTNFYFYWPTTPFDSSDMNCVSSVKMNKSSEVSVFTCNDLVLATKNSK